ncbi:TPA: TetR family transcriptional regulator [Streptococcus agalactiae]|uniref:TetR family transcriptional regulator n=8 Tax=Streptococcus agalactiae TaxID=1311 RepID=A0A076Z234_STRAG|nr:MULTISPECIES: TetR family transcriptional regulator [Streptococcus]AIK70862.1 TetR family transcriptional regulator [Streptococcus agalactiae]AIK72932.1 TetR family transcriptional regulator [Streptococcus agalactiae]AIK74997.1 TetR family transcriptional regulator [Streptococcus agalactiae]ARC43989.1 TetR/AcrR family transcriptional regulator [Streptococcus agalactiae]ASA98268.1 TetR family transcriptional regulator [Streptococcus agalactiae]
MKNNIIFSIEQYINDQEMPKGKQKVILSAIELFASQGFHGTSTAQLAKNAEVSQATIYKYFETKDKLLVFILELIVQTIGRPFFTELSTFSTKEELIHFFVQDRFKFIEKNNDLIKILMQELLINSETSTIFTKLINSTDPNITKIFNCLGEGNSLNKMEILRAVIGQFITFFIQLYILNIKPESLEEELKQIEKQILKLLS